MEGYERTMTSRNVFENNDPRPDEEDVKAVGSSPHIMLPPLVEGYHYTFTDLPSGRKAVTVEKDAEPSGIHIIVNEKDQFGRRRL
jgi:hypothetical protein